MKACAVSCSSLVDTRAIGSALTAVGSTSGNLGTAIESNGEGLSVGGGNRSNYGFAGQLDNVRFYNGDALSLSELVTVMQYNDMIPEPGSMVLLSLGGLVLTLRRRTA